MQPEIALLVLGVLELYFAVQNVEMFDAIVVTAQALMVAVKGR